jgi:hypothetical protein
MKPLPFVVLLIFAAGCGGHETSSSSDSGVQGKALLGPACPVEPCEVLEPPYHGSFEVRADGKLVKVVRTDSLGQFAARLEPGNYVLQSSGGGLPLLKPVVVTVRANEYTYLQLTFDSGIR